MPLLEVSHPQKFQATFKKHWKCLNEKKKSFMKKQKLLTKRVRGISNLPRWKKSIACKLFNINIKLINDADQFGSTLYHNSIYQDIANSYGKTQLCGEAKNNFWQPRAGLKKNLEPWSIVFVKIRTWLKYCLVGLKIFPSRNMIIKGSSQATISITKNPIHHDQTKLVEIDRYFGIIQMNYTTTKLQILLILLLKLDLLCSTYK